MDRLSSSIENIKDRYTVVVVGSGYGGAITAARLSRAGASVCVLERGRERVPGEYPDTLREAAEQLQVTHEKGHVGPRTGLYDVTIGDDLSVVKACGLGGTSLINANVSIYPAPAVFKEPGWPAVISEEFEAKGPLYEGYQRAWKMLSPNPYPETSPTLSKLVALEKSAAAMGKPFARADINVTFEARVNAAGVHQAACTLCGDCCSGCNVGAKNSTVMNYLPYARNHGAEIFTEVDVRHVESLPDGGYLVHYQALDTGREGFDAPLLFVRADFVILSGGSLGSTEILLRSRERGLSVSDRLGDGFHGNSDLLGFGYNCATPIHGVGMGERRADPSKPIGPTITGIIDLRDGVETVTDGIIIQEGVAPGALGPAFGEFLAESAKIGGTSSGGDLRVQLAQVARAIESGVRGPYHGAVAHTQTYLAMGHERSSGRLKLVNDRLHIEWPEVGGLPVFAKMNDRLVAATAALEGISVKDPIWSDVIGRKLVTVHPLGGCNMGTSAETAVVDARHRVFASKHGDAVHEGLYVCDGAVIPTSLGVNPLLTISALAERCAAMIAADPRLKIDHRPSRPSIEGAEGRKPGVRFTETMKGWFSGSMGDGYEAAAARGRQEGSDLAFILTIVSSDVDAMVSDPAHVSKMVGTVTASALSPNPLTAVDGVFNLFTRNEGEADVRNMRYRMKLVADDGRSWHFEGFKVVRERAIWHMWHDTSTLYVTLRDTDERGPVIGTGVLHIMPEDFVRQLGTLDVTYARSPAERLATTAKFGRYFAGVLYDYFGGVASPPALANSSAHRKRRTLNAPAPTMYPVKTADGVEILLTRYKGGEKGPVMLAHGLGVASSIFTIDTIDTNLLEYLTAHHYDVWLLDYRASIMLPASKAQYSADDVATNDYPAAVSEVLRRTGARSLQVVAHCYGGTTFTMAMLAGLQGVRSAVISQVSTHVVTPALQKFKCGLHVPEVLEALGVDSLTAVADRGESWVSRLYDRALELYPVDEDEHCTSAVCHRITFMYSLLYEHAQLNEATHDALYELFGEATVRAFEGLARIVRAGHIVGAEGEELYLPHLDRMAIPIRFIHGAENGCFLPRSTELTVEALRAVNTREGLYTREVIPGYGHIDCIFGKKAAKDVFPFIVEHLDKDATPNT